MYKAISENLTKRQIDTELRKSLKANREFYRKVTEDWKTTEVEGWPVNNKNKNYG